LQHDSANVGFARLGSAARNAGFPPAAALPRDPLGRWFLTDRGKPTSKPSSTPTKLGKSGQIATHQDKAAIVQAEKKLSSLRGTFDRLECVKKLVDAGADKEKLYTHFFLIAAAVDWDRTQNVSRPQRNIFAKMQRAEVKNRTLFISRIQRIAHEIESYRENDYFDPAFFLNKLCDDQNSCRRSLADDMKTYRETGNLPADQGHIDPVKSHLRQFIQLPDLLRNYAEYFKGRHNCRSSNEPKLAKWDSLPNRNIVRLSEYVCETTNRRHHPEVAFICNIIFQNMESKREVSQADLKALIHRYPSLRNPRRSLFSSPKK
jgi:hypothetical protein